jgi:hypothetical protein
LGRRTVVIDLDMATYAISPTRNWKGSRLKMERK